MNITEIETYLKDLQQRICESIEQHEPEARFISDEWQRTEGGGGITRVIANGKVIEKGGVNFSSIEGASMPATATAHRPELAGRSFKAMGLSIVMHPVNPYAPTSHANVRFFVAEKDGAEPVWWFGGGFDMTPYYGFDEDCQHWHQTAKDLCQPFNQDAYARYKRWCDDYFYLKHRNEPRGIGGLFYDDLNTQDQFGWDFEQCFAFMQAVGNGYIDAYLPIIKKRKDIPYTQRERDFQLYRRGRYVEFNLVFDRGTLFGLQSGGRTESILMSLPPKVEWHYMPTVEKNSPEEKLYSHYLQAKDWL